MSYSIGFAVPVTDDIPDLVQARLEGYPYTEDSRSQATAAGRAVQALLDSGEVGRGPWQVNLAGHANPGHLPTKGWSNDSVTISISLLTVPDVTA